MSTIVSIDDLQTYMSGDDFDAALGQQVVDAINATIAKTTGRSWGETEQVTERTNFTATIWLKHLDAVSVDSVKLGYPGQTQTTVASNRYFLSPGGRLTVYGAPQLAFRHPAYCEVAYTHGTAEQAPDDLKLAALAVAASYYRYSANEGNEVSETQVGAYRVRYANDNSSAASKPDPNWQVINSYRTRRF